MQNQSVLSQQRKCMHACRHLLLMALTDRSLLVHRLANNVDDATKGLPAHWHLWRGLHI